MIQQKLRKDVEKTEPGSGSNSLMLHPDVSNRRSDLSVENPKTPGRSEGRNIRPEDLNQFYFNPNSPELTRTWHDGAAQIITINAYPNGITFSVHAGIRAQEENCDRPRYHQAQFHLRFRDTRDYFLPEGKYYLYKENYQQALEHRLSQLHEQGKLESSVIYFGLTTDPFLFFSKKFNVTMNCLSLFEQYRPGLLVIQTRSPMVISALPTLRLLGNKAVVALAVESRLDSAIKRYTPGQPPVSERLLAASGLRAQGVKVNIVVSPLLPYGEIYRDAWDFAEMLDEHADYITFGCLSVGRQEEDMKLRHLAVAQKLVSDKHLRLLRPHSYRNLYYALKMVAPEKLLLPERVVSTKPAQLNLFAA